MPSNVRCGTYVPSYVRCGPYVPSPYVVAPICRTLLGRLMYVAEPMCQVSAPICTFRQLCPSSVCAASMIRLMCRLISLLYVRHLCVVLRPALICRLIYFAAPMCRLRCGTYVPSYVRCGTYVSFMYIAAPMCHLMHLTLRYLCQLYVAAPIWNLCCGSYVPFVRCGTYVLSYVRCGTCVPFVRCGPYLPSPVRCGPYMPSYYVAAPISRLMYVALI